MIDVARFGRDVIAIDRYGFGCAICANFYPNGLGVIKGSPICESTACGEANQK
jgi:hypothetical protein